MGRGTCVSGLRHLLRCCVLSAGSVHSGHELQVKARMLQMCWDSCGKLMEFVAHFWPEKRGSLYWCASFPLSCGVALCPKLQSWLTLGLACWVHTDAVRAFAAVSGASSS